MEHWTGLVGALVGAAIALLAVWLEGRRQDRQGSKRLMLSKLEELHELVGVFRLSHRREQVAIASHLKGAELPEVAEEEEPPVPTAKLEMLVGFYAPELQEPFDALNRRQEEFIEVYLEVMRSSGPRSEARTTLLQQAREASLALEEACSHLQAEAARAARRYMSKGFHVSPK